MRILMTGATVRAANALVRPPMGKIWNVPETFRDLWESVGIEVDWRAVQVGESVQGYDLVFVVAAPTGSVASPHGLNASWAMLQAHRQRVPLVVYFEDWRISNIFRNYASMARIGSRQLYKQNEGGRYLYAGSDMDQVREHEGAFLSFAAEVSTPGSEFWERTVGLVPKFDWCGDLSVLSRTMPTGDGLMSVDPTPLILHWTSWPAVAKPAEKERRWALAALPDHSVWVEKLHLEWPLDVYGPPKRPGSLGRLGTELEVFAQYARHWGVLSPPYYHAGSGWCRARTVFAPLAGSILYPGPKDGAIFGPAFALDPGQIERMGEEELQNLAGMQREQVLPKLVTDPGVTMAEFEDVFREARERVWPRSRRSAPVMVGG